MSTEFAIVKIRKSRIEQLVKENKKGAKNAELVVEHLDEYLSACQLGITVTSLGLGWIGEPTVAKLFHPIFERLSLSEHFTSILSFILAFVAVTYLHVVVGELAPKTIAIQKAEQITLLFSKPIIVFYKVLYPFIWVLNGSAKMITSMFGFKPVLEHESAHSEEEIKLLLSHSYESGEINQRELDYLNNIFEFDNKLAREIMVPRTQINILNLDDDIKDTIETIINGSHTRYPVTEKGNKDEILGILNVHEIMIHSLKGNKIESIKEFIKPMIFVIETTPVHELLLIMRKKRTHIAVLLDEYGGTSGIVTIEDILEEIVGDIQDEFDKEEIWIKQIREHEYIVNGKVSIKEVNRLLNIYIEGDDVDSIGGWLITQNFDIKKDDSFDYSGFRFTVKSMDKHHITYINVIILESEEIGE